MNYTQAQIDRANAVSLEDFLRTQGETLIKSGREYRWKEHDSLTVRGNKWFRHSQSKGGYPIAVSYTHLQACFIVPIAAARCMSTVPTTASVFLNIPVPNTAKSQLESSARPSTVSMKMWYCPLFQKCSKPLQNMPSMTEPSLSEMCIRDRFEDA